MSQDARAFNPASISHLQRNVAARDALRRKINRAEVDTEMWLAQKAVSNGVRLTNDPYLLQEQIPVLRAVQPAAKVAPIRSSKPKASCGFGDCQKDPDCALQCPDKPSATNNNCAPGMCEFKATCGDTHCHGHPSHSHVDHAARATFWRTYLGGVAIVVLIGAALLVSIH